VHLLLLTAPDRLCFERLQLPELRYRLLHVQLQQQILLPLHLSPQRPQWLALDRHRSWHNQRPDRGRA
jgi:hypothetical protein